MEEKLCFDCCKDCELLSEEQHEAIETGEFICPGCGVIIKSKKE